MRDIKILKISDPGYPDILKEIDEPPKLLYYRGSLDVLKHQPTIAVVGTRRCSQYGRQATEKIVSELAKARICIVSGMARGIDSFAHETALKYNAPTIAVLGSPVSDKEIYPQRNISLARRIIESGGIILSEHKEGTPGYASNFLKRNRIVAGLAQGTLVVESPLKGGSMTTASMAVKNNRDLYAVPGSIFSRLSEGCNFWISRGAKSVSTADAILAELELNPPRRIEFMDKSVENLSGEELKILKFISESPEAMHIDKISQVSKLETEKISQIIMSLMLKDFIKESSANSYISI